MEDLNYMTGKQAAQRQQAQGRKPTDLIRLEIEGVEPSLVPFTTVLRVAVQLRDGLRRSENKSRVDEALMSHLDGWLSQWD